MKRSGAPAQSTQSGAEKHDRRTAASRAKTEAIPRRAMIVFLAVTGFIMLTVARDLGNRNNANVWSHIALTFAVVEHGTFAIDPYIKATEDWSSFGGHYYSNKAPGPALAAVPFYFVQFQLQKRLGILPDDARARNLAVYLANVFTTILPTLVALALLCPVLMSRFALTPRQALAVGAAWATGSIGLVYAVVFFGHQTSAALLAIGLALSLGAKPTFRRIFLAGLAMGGALACDYFAGIGVVAWTAWLAWTTRRDAQRLKLWSAWVLGGAGPALVLGAYHYTCFGGFFTTPYAYINPTFLEMNALTAPEFARLLEITFLPFRGFFFWTPVWLLVFLSVRRIFADRPADLIAAAGALAAAFAYLSALPAAFGGACLGPRYIASLVPLFALLLVPAVKRVPRFFLGLLAVSTAFMLLGILTEPLPGDNLSNPFLQLIVPIMLLNEPRFPQWSIFRWLGMNYFLSWLTYMAIWVSGLTYIARRTR